MTGTTGDLGDRLGLNPHLEQPLVAPEADLDPEGVPEGSDDTPEAQEGDQGGEPDDAGGDDDDEPDDDDGGRAGREAKKYRQRLAESKAENAVLVEHVAELQTFVAHSLIAGKLARADDFDVFIGLDKVLDQDGRIDRAKVSAEVDALLADRPHLASKAKAPSRHPRIPEGNAAGAQTPAPNGRRTLSEQLGIDVDEIRMADLTARNSEYQQSRRAVTRHETRIGDKSE